MTKLEIFTIDSSKKVSIPFYLMSVAAGHPIPVDSEIENHVDLNEFLVEHPSSTFFAKVNGDDMSEVGIKDGDILIIDKSIKPTDGKFVLAQVNQDLVIKYYRNIDGMEYLESQNQHFFPLSIGEEFKSNILGTVTKIIHSF